MDAAFLAHLWAVLLGLMLVLYVVLDGFDLGIGILSIFVRNPRHRATMMASIGAVWDANETWLVLAGGTLFGAFPIVYSLALNALYIPIMMMLFGLVFRAVSFEFREHSQAKRPWEIAFGLGSLLAALGQGLALGGLLTGIRASEGGRFAGTPWDWFNAISIMIAVAVAFGYVMLGASYLLAKAGRDMQRSVHRMTLISSILMAVSVLAISLSMPLVYDSISQRWLRDPGRYFTWAMAVGAVFAFSMLLLSTIWRRFRRLPFAASLLVFATTFVGGVSVVYPYLVPPTITVTSAASSTPTLVFMLYGIGPLIPVMLLYNFYLYRVFRGNVSAHDGY
ncbi:MAG: cytochrome d ubiquinol oxidase subunit II [Phycisphaerae bacterium]|jgi:cytochrome d ubiquinol oxidase subunit II